MFTLILDSSDAHMHSRISRPGSSTEPLRRLQDELPRLLLKLIGTLETP